MSDIKVVLVNKKSEQKKEVKSQIEQQLHEFKITNNLINEINFNSTVNRFQYLQQLLRKQHEGFTKSINNIVFQQKETIKQIKNVQKQVKQIKLPSINYNRIIVQSQELIRLKKQSDKNAKLSQGMLVALSKMENQLNNLVLGKQKGEKEPKQEMQPVL